MQKLVYLNYNDFHIAYGKCILTNSIKDLTTASGITHLSMLSRENHDPFFTEREFTLEKKYKLFICGNFGNGLFEMLYAKITNETNEVYVIHDGTTDYLKPKFMLDI